MSVSSVSSYTAVYSPPLTSGKQATNASEPIQVPKLNPASHDTVAISAEASHAQRMEQYPLKDSVELFMDWKERGEDVIYMGEVPKELGELLPENLELISKLREEEKTMPSSENKMLIEANISTITRYGDKEIFTNREDADSRLRADSQSATLQVQYLFEKNGKLPFEMRTEVDALGVRGISISDDLLGNYSDGYQAMQPKNQHDSNVDKLLRFNDREYLDSLLENFTWSNFMHPQQEA